MVKSSEATAHSNAAVLWAPLSSELQEYSNSIAIVPFRLLLPEGQLCTCPEFITLAQFCSTNQP